MTVWYPTDDGHADLADHDSYVNGTPHNTFQRLPEEDLDRLEDKGDALMAHTDSDFTAMWWTR